MRLFVLSTLAERGPMHGHQLRHQAREDRAELWTDVKVGTLYGALRRLAGEGLIVDVRNERAGHYPERTVYGLTPLGRRALLTEHDAALRAVVFPADPFDLALSHPGELSEAAMRQVVADRLAALVQRLDSWRHQLQAADPYLTGAERLAASHTTARLDAEIAWHGELLERLPDLFAGAESEDDAS